MALATLLVEANGNGTYAETELRGGIRFLSLQQLNNALTNTKLNDGVCSFYLGIGPSFKFSNR
jgi:hypothetical protein